jgi:hypothetical protein
MVELGRSASVTVWSGASGASAIADPVSGRDALAEAVARLGGVDGLVEWVMADEKNEEKFWTILFPRLLAAQSSRAGAANGPGKATGPLITAVEWRVREIGAAPDDEPA